MRIWIVTIVLPLLLLAGGVAAKEELPCQHTVAGQISVEGGFDGASLQICLCDDEDHQHPIATIHPDATGSYVFNGVCDGNYTLIVSADAHRTVYVDVGVPLQERLDIAMSAEDGITIDTVDIGERDTGILPGDGLVGGDLDRGLNLGQTLASLNGVAALETGSVAKPMVNGMHGSRVLLLFDGVRHEGQSWGVDHGPELDPFAAERVTVIRGAAGVRYGADAIGGTILAESPALTDEFGGEVNLVGTSNGRAGAGSFQLHGGLPGVDGFGWRLQGSGKLSGALEAPDYVLDNTGHREVSFSGAVGYDALDWGLEVSFSRYDATNGLFTGMYSENVSQFYDAVASELPLQVEYYRFDYDIDRAYQTAVHTMVIGKGHVQLGTGRLSATVAHQINDRQEYDNVRGNITGPQLDFLLTTTSGELLWEMAPRDWLAVSVGTAGSMQENVYNGRRYMPNYREFRGGLFGWTTLFLAGGTELEVGARVDASNVETFQRGRVGGSSAPIESHDLDFVTPSFHAGAVFRPSEALTLRTGLTSASRAPTVNELLVDGVSQVQAAYEKGDLTLDSEQTYGLYLDAEWEPLSWLRADIGAFAQRIDDFIYLAPRLGADGEPLVTLTINGGFPSFEYEQVDALYTGGDAEVTLSPLSWLEYRSRAAFIRARDREEGRYLPFIPADRYEQRLRFLVPDLPQVEGLHIGVTWEHVTRQDRVDLNADFAPPPPGYDLLHARIGSVVPLAGQRLRWEVEVRNLLDTSYRSYLSRLRYFADEPGRSVILRLNYAF